MKRSTASKRSMDNLVDLERDSKEQRDSFNNDRLFSVRQCLTLGQAIEGCQYYSPIFRASDPSSLTSSSSSSFPRSSSNSHLANLNMIDYTKNYHQSFRTNLDSGKTSTEVW